MVIEMIKREKYLNEIRGFYDSDLIKIITGVRRSGKSMILNQIMDEIKEKSDNIIYLNFEDETTLDMIPNSSKLIEYVNTNRKDGKCYLFFDEIHEVEDWDKACKTLRLHDNSVFITGSNSKILSKEYTDGFSGRYVSFVIRPFVYKELLLYSQETGNDYGINDYLIWGGFPKILEFSRQQDRLKYLEDVFESIVNRDLIIRFNIRNVTLFKKITRFILRNNARVFSCRSVENYLKNEKVKCSINTIIKYLSYLEIAYVISRIKPYSGVTKKELSYTFKLYDVDVAMNSVNSIENRYDLTHNLENVVYNELIYMGYDVRVFNDEKREIDFIASKGNMKYYIQVAYSVVDDKTYEREFKAFDAFGNDAKKIIITNDDVDFSTSVVEHIKLKDFLLMDELK